MSLYSGTDHFNSISFGNKSSTTVKTKIILPRDCAICNIHRTTVLSVSRSFAGASIIGKYPVVVFSVWMILCFLLKLVQVHFGVSF